MNLFLFVCSLFGYHLLSVYVIRVNVEQLQYVQMYVLMIDQKMIFQLKHHFKDLTVTQSECQWPEFHLKSLERMSWASKGVPDDSPEKTKLTK
jgi:hypothetical protein